jgi:STE24 endopeptidase
LAPLIIFPWFYTFKPLGDEDLRARLSRLAANAGVRLERIDEVNLSAKTRAANAALAGLGRTRRILLGDTLLNHFTKDEIETVIAHELGHYVGRHLWSRIAIQTAAIFLFLALIHAGLRAFGPALGYQPPADPAAIPFMALVASLAALVVLPPSNTLMRAMERAADRYAVRATGRPWALVATLERLAQRNLSDPEPNRLVELLFHSHPSIARRIAECRRYAEAAGLPLAPPVEPPGEADADRLDSSQNAI